METIKAIRLVKENLGLTTVLGVSNVSHGLPQRSWLNNTFLALAVGAGLDAAIANPLDQRVGETIAAASLLADRDPGARNYLLKAGKAPVALQSPVQEQPTKEITLENLHHAILQGRQEKVAEYLPQLLTQHDVLTLINEGLIPPLEKIGNLFGRGEIFLPELMLAAEASKKAFTYLKEHLPEQDLAPKATIILGTVKGDIHDIGKNIVKALLENHGYRVIDLGKSVPASAFVEAVKKEKAKILGLSALMTTTMTEMAEVISLVKKEKLDVKVIVGGAVVTAEYAQEIGAQGFAPDAVLAVKLVQDLLTEEEEL